MRGTPPALQIAAENFPPRDVAKVATCRKMDIVHQTLNLINDFCALSANRHHGTEPEKFCFYATIGITKLIIMHHDVPFRAFGV